MDHTAISPPQTSSSSTALVSASPERAWKFVRELVLNGRTDALALAAEFAEIAAPSTDKLLKLWSQALDPDGFAEHLLAPPSPGRDVPNWSSASATR
ncbi:hypothetical protein ABZ297_01965 [Nonomuraea sp. NPDC005983]|uniref:hypothetical protein n=1 Tax=Nonomuraea sp. NPDC005983 TaxID=3155595 RepID=UPI0033B5A919